MKTWFKYRIIILSLLTSQAFGAEKFLLNPAQDEDYLIKINDGGVIKDLFRADASLNKVVIDGDIDLTGVSTGFTAASAAPNWAISTSYGLNEVVVDGNSGILYRATSAHTSPGTGNLTDDLGNWEIIGSASNGAIIAGWDTLAVTSSQTTNSTTSAKFRRIGDSIEVLGYRVYTGVPNAANNDWILPAGFTPDLTKVPSGSNDTIIVGNWWARDSSSGIPYDGNATLSGSNTILLNYNGDTSTVDHDTPFAFDNGDFISVKFTVPIQEYNNTGITVPISGLTERTKTVDNAVVGMVGAGGSTILSIGDFSAYAYKDTNGEYWLHLAVASLNFTANAVSHRVDFPGLSWAGVNQALAISPNNSFDGFRGVTAGTDAFIITSGTNTWDNTGLNGPLKLSAKPPWFDANRENPAAVSAFVPEASVSQAGIVGVGAQSFLGPKTFSSFATVAGTANGNADDAAFGTTDASSNQNGLTIFSNSTQLSNIYFGDEASSLSGQIYYNHADDSLSFLTAVGTSGFSINSSNVVKIGQGFSGGNAGSKLRADSNGAGIASEFKTTSTTGNGAAVIAWNSNTADTTSPPLWIAHGSTKTNNIRMAQFYGTATAIPQSVPAGGISTNNGVPAFYSDSDIRLKKDITTYNDDVLSKFDDLRLVNYSWKDDDTNKKNLGVIAQEAELIFPEMIHETDDGEGDEVPDGVIPWSVSSNWNYQLIQAIKQLSEKVKSLESEVKYLKAANE